MFNLYIFYADADNDFHILHCTFVKTFDVCIQKITPENSGRVYVKPCLQSLTYDFMILF